MLALMVPMVFIGTPGTSPFVASSKGICQITDTLESIAQHMDSWRSTGYMGVQENIQNEFPNSLIQYCSNYINAKLRRQRKVSHPAYSLTVGIQPPQKHLGIVNLICISGFQRTLGNLKRI